MSDYKNHQDKLLSMLENAPPMTIDLIPLAQSCLVLAQHLARLREDDNAAEEIVATCLMLESIGSFTLNDPGKEQIPTIAGLQA